MPKYTEAERATQREFIKSHVIMTASVGTPSAHLLALVAGIIAAFDAVDAAWPVADEMPTATETAARETADVEKLVAERLRIDRALAAAGIVVTESAHGLHWSKVAQ